MTASPLAGSQSRPDLVLVHGWGMNPAVWAPLEKRLKPHFEVHCPALPGHGGMPMIPGWSAASLAQSWLEIWPDAFWLGWSLGAQVVLAAAGCENRRMRGAVLLGGTPRFVATGEWSCAMAESEFQAFKARCGTAPETTLQQFLGLQVLGSEQRGSTLRVLRKTLAAAPETDRQALLGGLEVLQQTDLRPALAGVPCPVLWLSGEQDQLTPAAAARRSAAAMTHSRVECLPGAGHAPFISHEGEVADQVSRWFLEECA